MAIEEIKFIGWADAIDNDLDLVDTVKNNHEMYRILREKIKLLEKYSLESDNNQMSSLSELNKIDLKIDEDEENEEDEYQFYYNSILEIKNDDEENDEIKQQIINDIEKMIQNKEISEHDKDKIIEEKYKDALDEKLEMEIEVNLPVYYNSGNQKIVNRIKGELHKEINDLNELSDESTKSEDLKYIKSEIQFINKKLSAIDKVLLKERIESASGVKKENKIIFMKTGTPYGDTRYGIDNDIKSIPQEYYEKLGGLLESIKDGTLKNVKQFNTTQRKVNGLIEVKDFKLRIVFVRLNADTYIVLTAFMKKEDTSEYYFSNLESKNSTYLYYKKEYQKILKEHPEYLESENKKYEELLDLFYNRTNKRGDTK